MRDLRAISGQCTVGRSEGQSGQFWTLFWTHSRPLSRPSLRNLKKRLHLAVGRASGLEYVKYGVLGGYRVVHRYSPPRYPPESHTPGTPLLPPACRFRTVLLPRGHCRQTKYSRGAHIRRATHFKSRDLRVPDYDRGL